MKKTFIAILILASLSSCGILGKKASKTITLTFTYTSDHCGGEPPTEELLKELMTPKPLSDTLYAYDNSDQEGDPIILAFQKGSCTIVHPGNGTYFVFSSTAMSVESLSHDPMEGDPNCFVEFSKMVYATLEITDETEKFEQDIHWMCNPCIPPRP